MTMGYHLSAWKVKVPGSRNNDAINRGLMGIEDQVRTTDDIVEHLNSDLK